MGSNREDGGCRNGVVYRASFLRNNDSRKVGDPIGFNAQRAMHIWDMKGRRRRAPLGHFFCATGALASRALPKPCRGRCALPAGFARFRGRVPWIVSLSPSLFFFFSPPPSLSPLLLPHCPFPIPSFRARFLARFPACVRLSRRLAGRVENISGAACGLVVGPAQLGAVCAGNGGKRAGPSALFCLKWVGGGAGPTKTAGLMNGSSPFFFFPCETPAPRQRPGKPPGRMACRGLFR